MPDTSFSANQTVESVHDNIDSGMAKEIESSFHVKESQDDVDEDLGMTIAMSYMLLV